MCAYVLRFRKCLHAKHDAIGGVQIKLPDRKQTDLPRGNEWATLNIGDESKMHPHKSKTVVIASTTAYCICCHRLQPHAVSSLMTLLESFG